MEKDSRKPLTLFTHTRKRQVLYAAVVKMLFSKDPITEKHSDFSKQKRPLKCLYKVFGDARAGICEQMWDVKVNNKL